MVKYSKIKKKIMLNFLNILSCFITRLFFLLILQLYESWEVARNVWLLMILIFNMPVLSNFF